MKTNYRLGCWLVAAVLLSAGCGRSAQPVAAEQSKPQPHPATTPSKEAAVPDPASFAPPQKIDSGRAMAYLREIVAIGPRGAGSTGHAKLQRYLQQKLAGDQLEVDGFSAQTPSGTLALKNFIAKYPGQQQGVIVVASHYDTAPTIKNFVGANDGGSSTALLLELANQLRAGSKQRPSVWLVWFDAEEAFKSWSDEDSLYGSRHLAEKWQKEGTLKQIKAFILTDMIGDSDLSIEKDSNSTEWLQNTVYKAAANLGYQSYFFARPNTIGDDHIPFVLRGVPSVDLIDLDYGYNNAYWHTPEDTLDKISPKSLQVVGDTVLETIRLLAGSTSHAAS
jgi:hypothetical protein